MRAMSDEELGKDQVLEEQADQQEKELADKDLKEELSELDTEFQSIYNTLVLEIDNINDYLMSDDIVGLLKNFKTTAQLLSTNPQMLEQKYQEVNAEIVALMRNNTKPIGIIATETLYDDVDGFFKKLNKEDYVKYVASMYQLVEFANHQIGQILQSQVIQVMQDAVPDKGPLIN